MRITNLAKRVFIIILAVLSLILASEQFAFAEGVDITVLYDGNVLEFDTKPIIDSDSVIIPARAVFEAFGMNVLWNDIMRMVTVSDSNTQIKMIIDFDAATVNSRAYKLTVPARIIGGRTYIPLRFISEATGKSVNWDEKERQVVITSSQSGSEIEKALADLDSMFNEEDILGFYASLYDKDDGGFYVAPSARDYRPFTPDFESTMSAGLFVLKQLALIPQDESYYDYLPKDYIDGIVDWFWDKMDESDGFFYRAPYGKSVNEERKSRDLSCARQIAEALDIEPPSPFATDRLKNTDSVPEYLSSEENFKNYLDSLSWDSDPYRAASTVTNQIGYINAVGLIDFTQDYISSKINPETGLYGSGVSYATVNAAMKATYVYLASGREYPYYETAMDNIITVMLSDEVPGQIVDVYNPWAALNRMRHLQKSITPEVEAKLFESAPEMIRKSAQKLAMYKRDGGGFSYFPNSSISTGEGTPVSLGLLEGDVNGTGTAISGLRANILETFDIPNYCPFDSEGAIDRYIEKLKSATKIEKLETLTGAKVDFENYEIGDTPLDSMVASSAGNGEIKIIEDPEDFTNKVCMLKGASDANTSIKINNKGGDEAKKVIYKFRIMFTDMGNQTPAYQFSFGGYTFMFHSTRKSATMAQISYATQGGTYGDPIASLETNRWYSVRCEYDPDLTGNNKPKIAIYFDDRKVLSTNSFWTGGVIGTTAKLTLDGFNIADSKASNATMLIDDIDIYLEDLK